MIIRETKQEDLVILEPEGRLDTKTSHEFEKKLLEHLGAGQRRFVIDLATLEYLSSAGLRVLLMLAKKISGTEGALALCSMSDHVREVFEIAGFMSVFTVRGTRAEAIDASKSVSKVDRVAEMAAKTLGVSASSPAAAARVSKETNELVARAARLLGVAGAAPEEPARAGKDGRKGTWVRT